MSDLFGGGDEARQARDEALERVRRRGGNWRDKALTALSLIAGFEGTGEDIRIRLQLRGLDPPHHHNAWGEMIKAALERQRLVKIGRRQMRTRKSHARVTDVYRVLP